MTIRFSFMSFWIQFIFCDKMISNNWLILHVSYGNNSTNNLIKIFKFTKDGLGSQIGWYMYFKDRKVIYKVKNKE